MLYILMQDNSTYSSTRGGSYHKITIRIPEYEQKVDS